MRLLKLCPVVAFLQGILLARVTGRIISNFLIMGDVCKLLTKSLHRLIKCRGGWDAQLVLDADVLLELNVWS